MRKRAYQRYTGPVHVCKGCGRHAKSHLRLACTRCRQPVHLACLPEHERKCFYEGGVAIGRRNGHNAVCVLVEEVLRNAANHRQHQASCACELCALERSVRLAVSRTA